MRVSTHAWRHTCSFAKSATLDEGRFVAIGIARSTRGDS